MVGGASRVAVGCEEGVALLRTLRLLGAGDLTTGEDTYAQLYRQAVELM